MTPDFKILRLDNPNGFAVEVHHKVFFGEAQKGLPDLRRWTHHLFEAKAEGDGRVIGGAFITRYHDLIAIETLWVAEDFKGRKVGRDLYHAIIDYARENKIELLVGTSLASEAAVSFWTAVKAECFATIEMTTGKKIQYFKKHVEPAPI